MIFNLMDLFCGSSLLSLSCIRDRGHKRTVCVCVCVCVQNECRFAFMYSVILLVLTIKLC